MLQIFRLGPAHVAGSDDLPPFLSALARAGESGSDLVPHIATITRRFGFDSFTYTGSMRLPQDHENKLFEFTTLPAVWAFRYDQNAYIEVDPRVKAISDCTVPVLWDQATTRACSPCATQFLDDALSVGVASGVCIPLYDADGTNSVVEFDSVESDMKSQRESAIRHALSDMFIFARYFHELFKRATLERLVQARSAGMPLSEREIQCLTLAAMGGEIDAFANSLGIDVRILRRHFDSIRSKLGVASLAEAMSCTKIGRAVS